MSPLFVFRIFEHGLQEIFFVANKVHNVVVITTAGGHSFYEETQIRLGRVQHRFALTDTYRALPHGIARLSPEALRKVNDSDVGRPSNRRSLEGSATAPTWGSKTFLLIECGMAVLSPLLNASLTMAITRITTAENSLPQAGS